MRFLFILILVTGSFAVNLDTLLGQSSSGAHKARDLHGYLARHSEKHLPDTANQSPASIFSKSKEDSFRGPVDRNHKAPLLFMDAVRNEERINQLEISVAKMSVILDNMQKQSDSHTNNIDVLIKIFEILIGSLTTIAASVIGIWKFKATSKK